MRVAQWVGRWETGEASRMIDISNRGKQATEGSEVSALVTLGDSTIHGIAPTHNLEVYAYLKSS